MAQQQEAAAGLVRGLGSASPAEQLEAARGLEQLADAPGGAQRIQRAGGVPALVRLLQQGGGASEELQIAAADALMREIWPATSAPPELGVPWRSTSSAAARLS
jgi:hypothetical protein